MAIESMRDCVFGEWDGGRRQLKTLPDPVVESLEAVPDEDIFVTKLRASPLPGNELFGGPSALIYFASYARIGSTSVGSSMNGSNSIIGRLRT